MENQILKTLLKENDIDKEMGALNQLPNWAVTIIKYELSQPFEAGVMQLPEVAHSLAMNCLQSTRYQTDAQFKKDVDNVLAITVRQPA